MARWTKKAVLELINAYKRKSFLWNKYHKNFFCRHTRANAWVEIAGMFEVEPEIVKRKIKTLIATYRQQLCLVRKTTNRGQATYESLWFAYKALDSFLHHKYTETSTAEYDPQATLDATTENDNDATTDDDNHTTADNDKDVTTDNDEVQIIENDEVVQVYKIDDSSEDETHPNEEDVLIASNDITKQETNTDGDPLPGHHKMDDCEPSIKRPKLAEAQYRARTYADVRKKDDCDLFGKYLSATMREFDRKTRCVVQYLVNNILCQADLGAFQDGTFDYQSLVGFRSFNIKSECNE
ncbi:Myb/SANT-like transcription factor, partial [Oryctes borbonicus]